MATGGMKSQNRRYSSEESIDVGWDILWKMGIPALYVSAVLLGVVGVVCTGITTHYWTNLTPPMCYLYSQVGQGQFGGALINCYWATWGGATGLTLTSLCGFLYIFKLRTKGADGVLFKVLLIAMIVACTFMLAVSCTVSEGMRVTCASMGLNQVNNRGTNCYGKLEQWVQAFVIPVSTSSMIQASVYSLWGSTIFTFIATCFHLSKFYKSF